MGYGKGKVVGYEVWLVALIAVTYMAHVLTILLHPEGVTKIVTDLHRRTVVYPPDDHINHIQHHRPHRNHTMDQFPIQATATAHLVAGLAIATHLVACRVARLAFRCRYGLDFCDYLVHPYDQKHTHDRLQNYIDDEG